MPRAQGFRALEEMHELIAYVGTVFMGFFAIMNPLANTPVFLALTSNDDHATRKLVARQALLTALLIVTIFAVAGKLLFDLFGITLPAFRITGGILVFVIGYAMLHGESSKVHAAGGTAAPSRESQLGVAISPLAVPILAGPGTIATAMSFAAEGGLAHVAVTVAIFAVLCAITYVFFVWGEALIRYVGEHAVAAVTRMMGLILAVIGVQMFLDGMRGALQTLR